VRIEKRDVQAYVDWIKLLVPICSAAVLALLYRSEVMTGKNPCRWAVLWFSLAILALVLAPVGFIEHKRAGSSEIAWYTLVTLVLGYTCFLLAFGDIVLVVFSP
jgi:hypothetical protein